MTFAERVDFYVDVCGLSREDAEQQARRDMPKPDLEPSGIADGEPFTPSYVA